MAKAKRKSTSGKKKVVSKPSNAKTSGMGGLMQLGQQVWPMERDVLFRPDRLKYVRKLIQNEGCVFCNAAEKDISFETLCVYKTKHTMVVLNKFPYNSGHILVLPRNHKGSVFDLTEVEFADLNQTLRKAMKAVYDIYQPGGMNVGLNHGQVAGAGIPDHLHYHLIPRWSGDLNFFPLIADTKVVIESLEQTYERLHSHFKSQKESKS